MPAMADVTLTDLLLGESPRIEWKQSVDAVDIIHAVCALANDLEDSQQPGYVVLGVDKLGKIVGATDKRKAPLPLFGPAMDEQQQALTSRILSLKLLPHPSLTISAHEAEGKTLLVIAVAPYPVPPEVRVDGVAYVRVGTTTRRATEADLLKLRERRPLHRQPFDVRPMPGAQLSDLTLIDLSPRYESDREEADDPETFPSLEKWLSQKNLGRIVDGRLKPNAAALLVYGKNPQDFFPGAVIELARYAGTEVDAPVTLRKSISGTLPEQLEQVNAQLDAQLVSRPVGEPGIRAIYREEYPTKALRELARNLVQHRIYEGTHAPSRIEWYDDRVEFVNPGGPFGRASEGEFGSHSDYRNPTITQLLAESGYVEQLGRGVRMVRAQLAKNGNPPLEVEQNGFTQVIVRRRP